jgi:hypothetical protein
MLKVLQWHNWSLLVARALHAGYWWEIRTLHGIAIIVLQEVTFAAEKDWQK